MRRAVLGLLVLAALGAPIRFAAAYEGQGTPTELNAAKQLFRAGRYSLAEAKLKEITGRAPGDGQIEPNNLLAFTYYKQDKLEAASAQFGYTLELIETEARKNQPDPTEEAPVDARFETTYYAAVEVLVRSERYIEAIRIFDRVQQRPSFGKNPALQQLLGLTLLATGQYDRAVAAFQRQERLEANPETDYHIACARARQGRLKDARRALAKAIQRRPELRAQAEADPACFAAIDLNTLGS